VKHAPKGKREVDHLMASTHNSSHGQVCDTAIHVRDQMKPRLALPGAMDRYVFKVCSRRVARSWRSIDVGNQFQVDLKFSIP